MQIEYSIDELLTQLAEWEASDLHLTVGSPPVVRIRGNLEQVENLASLGPEETQHLLYRILTTEQQKVLEVNRQIDLSYSIPGVARFRVNVYHQRGSLGAAFRLIPEKLKTVEELGLPPVLHDLTAKPRGLVLVTGPTGSGKTTTLYSILSLRNTPGVNISTIEDPVEYQLVGVNQIQAKPAIGLDFAQALRSIVRQDPDIIMIGEMRDLETARIAIQSALTGHLVLSTLHTNNEAGGISRLLDMGVEDYLLTSTINGILAQRLVRRIEPAHAERYEPLPEVIEEFGLRKLQPEGTIYLWRPKPSALTPTGYLGRTTIMEFLVMTDSLRRLVMQRAGMGEIETAARDEGMRTMYEDGLVKALIGMTTIEEVLRVCTKA